MENDFQTGWIAADTGKSSAWFAGRSLCCQDVGHVLPHIYIFQISDACPGMPSDRGLLAGLHNGSVQCAIQLEIQGKGRSFVNLANILLNHIEN